MVLVLLSSPTQDGRASAWVCLDCISRLAVAGELWIGVGGRRDRETVVEMGVFETFQIPYSALEPEHDEVLRRVAEAGAGVIIRGSVAKGSPVAEAGDSRTFARTRPRWDKSQLGALAPEIDSMELILRFTLSHPAAHIVIVGTQSLEHMAANMEAAAKGPLDPALVERYGAAPQPSTESPGACVCPRSP